MSELNIITYNVRGINEYCKHRNVFHYMHKKDYHIMLLQETHSSKEQKNRWSSEWGSKIWYSHGATNARGVAILFNKKVNIEVHNVLRDKECGRYLIIYGTIARRKVVIANVYAPNSDDSKFVNEFLLGCSSFSP